MNPSSTPRTPQQADSPNTSEIMEPPLTPPMPADPLATFSIDTNAWTGLSTPGPTAPPTTQSPQSPSDQNPQADSDPRELSRDRSRLQQSTSSDALGRTQSPTEIIDRSTVPSVVVERVQANTNREEAAPKEMSAIQQEIYRRAKALIELTDDDLRKLPIGRPSHGVPEYNAQGRLNYIDFKFPIHIERGSQGYNPAEEPFREPPSTNANISGLSLSDYPIGQRRAFAGWTMAALPPLTYGLALTAWVGLGLTVPIASIPTALAIVAVGGFLAFKAKETIVTTCWKNGVMENLIALEKASNTGAEITRRLEILYSTIRDGSPLLIPKLYITQPSEGSRTANDIVHFLDAFRKMAVFALLNYSAVGKLGEDDRKLMHEALRQAGIAGIDYRFDQLVGKLTQKPTTGHNRESPIEALERRWNWLPLSIYDRVMRPLSFNRFFDKPRK